jgi:N-acetylglutamate synthase-like GNAT family acetyltransferase
MDEHVIRVSAERSDVDIDWLHTVLSERAYWALGRSRELVERSVEHSLCFSALDGGRQVGFARVISDLATFAWVCDVFVDADRRGEGIGRMLMVAITSDPRLQGLKRTVLVTGSPEFYAPFGFALIDRPERWMLRQGPGPTD